MTDSLDVITTLVKGPYFTFCGDLIPFCIPTSPHPNLLQNSSSFISVFNIDSSFETLLQSWWGHIMTPGNWMCVCAEQNWRQCSCTKLKKIKTHISLRILVPNYSVFFPYYLNMLCACFPELSKISKVRYSKNRWNYITSSAHKRNSFSWSTIDEYDVIHSILYI